MRHLRTKRTTIIDVHPSMGGWIIVDDSGDEYRTGNQWLVHRAEEFAKSATPSDLHFVRGWFYRDLTGITPVVEPIDLRPMAKICSWCSRVVSEGRRPATHTICASCKDNMDAELTAKYGIDSQGNPA